MLGSQLKLLSATTLYFSPRRAFNPSSSGFGFFAPISQMHTDSRGKSFAQTNGYLTTSPDPDASDLGDLFPFFCSGSSSRSPTLLARRKLFLPSAGNDSLPWGVLPATVTAADRGVVL